MTHLMSSETVNQDEAAQTTREADERVAQCTCPACGATARRAEARFCSTCGRALEDGYLPADGLRSSYNLERRRLAGRKLRGAQPEFHMALKFSSAHGNATAHTALAFLTYSLVPYLGILFCPGAVVLGSIGLARSLRAPQRGGRRASYASIALGLLVLCVQILLWWIIIKVPEWTRPL
jgi:hypothetical protein